MITSQLIEQLFLHLGFEDAQIEVNEQPDEILVKVTCAEEQSGILIGYHGETLSALQRIIQLMDPESEVPIRLDVNEYRAQRLQALEERVRDVASRVRETGETYEFEYLPAFERRFIHTLISESSDLMEVESVSQGEGWERRLLIQPKAA